MAGAYDVAIVGGGSAGCVVAARLSEEPHCRVLLLERGPDPRPLPEAIGRADGVLRVHAETPYVRRYTAHRSVDGSVFHPLAGHVLGGGSSINVMAASRGLAWDFDSWARTVDPMWRWDEVLPVFKRMEHDADFGETELHGRSGPLWVERRARIADFTGWERAFRDACLDLGYPASDDLNKPDAYGVSPFPWTIRNGRRQSAAIAYLEPVRHRRNLTILDEATVTAIELVGESAVGVRYTRGGREHRASVGEIVLCAGVYHSPQVLMLSGIGPSDELRRHGIEVRAALREVGENLQDHASVFPAFEWRHDGPVEWPGICPVLLAKSGESRDVVDLHVIPRGPISIAGMPSIAPLGVYLLEQRNRGRLRLASADPTALPTIEPRILDDEEDLEAIVAGMRLVCRLVGTPPLRPYYGQLFQPAMEEDWRDYARRTYDSYHHGAGTCRMGPSGDPGAVVDARLCVQGIQRLRVADASIMPTIVHANTNLTAMMIGERCADFILGER